MSKAKANNPEQKKNSSANYEDDLFKNQTEEPDELESDGSASAFDETESVNEDNFDHLSEK